MTIKEWRIARGALAKLFPIVNLAKESWWKQALVTLISLALIPISLVNPYLAQLAIDGPLMTKSTSGFLKFGVVIGLISLGIMVMQNYVTFRQNRLSTNLRELVTKKLYLRLTSMSLDFFRQYRRDRYSSVLSKDGVEVVVWAIEFLPKVFVVGLTVLARLIMVFVIDWRLGLLVFLSPPFYLLKANILARKNRISARVSRETGIAYSKEIDDSLGTIDVVKTFRAEDYHNDRVSRTLEKIREFKIRDHRFALVFGSIAGFMIKAMDGIPALVGAVLVTSGRISVGQLSAGLIFITQCAAAQSEFMELIPGLAERAPSINILTEFLKKRPSVIESPNAEDCEFAGADIVIENVTFSYLPEMLVLENVSFVIQGGRWTGIKAPSGYGKTTLFNLILRLYDVQKGRITINGRDVREIKFRCFADQTSAVMQQIFISRDSLRRCIAYDRENASLDEIREAARLSGIDEFICSLPNGYYTYCGDAAALLSQGQRQRLMIARALLRRPKILFMDEAFGSVDKETEDRIVTEMRSRFPEMTVIVVSHHDSILEKMDVVIDLTSCCSPASLQHV